MDNFPDIYEIPLSAIREHGSVSGAIAAGMANIWTPDRIRGAFNFGHGSIRDFRQYMINNMRICCFIPVSEV